jgi:hypothetical protein
MKIFPVVLQLAGISKHADDYDKLAEAEQFMFEVSYLSCNRRMERTCE